MEKDVKVFMQKLREIKGFSNVKFIFLYGSQITGKANKMSDYDFAVYYEGNEKERFNFLIDANFSDKFDVKIFQDLPLFIRKEVLRGRVVYVKNREFLYEIVYKTIKDFEFFKRYYYDYIGLEKIK